MENTALYVSLGLQEKDPGYLDVTPTIESLGQITPLSSALWYLVSPHDIQEAFQAINTSMMNPRIDSSAGLLLLDPATGYAKWHLRQPLSDLLDAHWGYQNNIFISFSLKAAEKNQQMILNRIAQIGPWAPISRTTWYVSSSISTKDAFHYMLHDLEGGDRLCVFDSQGNQAVWMES